MDIILFNHLGWFVTFLRLLIFRSSAVSFDSIVYPSFLNMYVYTCIIFSGVSARFWVDHRAPRNAWQWVEPRMQPLPPSNISPTERDERTITRLHDADHHHGWAAHWLTLTRLIMLLLVQAKCTSAAASLYPSPRDWLCIFNIIIYRFPIRRRTNGKTARINLIQSWTTTTATKKKPNILHKELCKYNSTMPLLGRVWQCIYTTLSRHASWGFPHYLGTAQNSPCNYIKTEFVERCHVLF